MIALLRGAALLANLILFAGLPLLLGASPLESAGCAALAFAISWWACGLHPRGRPAGAESRDAAFAIARRLGAPEPRFVSSVPGWTAASVRSGTGYGLILGQDVSERHRDAVIAHEVAHYLNKDLFWEPFTDGPARLLLSLTGRVPPLTVVAVPFLVTGAPLARRTEVAADRLAARSVSSYLAVLKEVAEIMEGLPTMLYPSLRTRIRLSARDS